MKLSAAALSLLALVLPVFSVPVKVPIPEASGPIQEDSYIMCIHFFSYFRSTDLFSLPVFHSKLKDGANKSEHLAQLANYLGESGSAISYDYDVIHGYSAMLKGPALDFVQSSKDVEYIELDSILTLIFEFVLAVNQ